MYIVQNEAQMVVMIQEALTSLRKGGDEVSAEMVILPMVVANNPAAAKNLLLQIKSFQPRIDGDGLPVNAAGMVTLNKGRTVHDLLDELESATMISPSDLDIVFNNCTQTHVPGKTRKVEIAFAKMMGMGTLIVDLQKAATASGLPIKTADKIDFTAFVREIPDHRNNDVPRTVLVFVKGTSDPGNGGGSDRVLQPMISRLVARNSTGHEPSFGSFHAQDLDDGWMLLNNKLFGDILGWVKGNSWNVVKLNQDRGGLDIEV